MVEALRRHRGKAVVGFSADEHMQRQQVTQNTTPFDRFLDLDYVATSKRLQNRTASFRTALDETSPTPRFSGLENSFLLRRLGL